jgi:hypothetical protein
MLTGPFADPRWYVLAVFEWMRIHTLTLEKNTEF